MGRRIELVDFRAKQNAGSFVMVKEVGQERGRKHTARAASAGSATQAHDAHVRLRAIRASRRTCASLRRAVRLRGVKNDGVDSGVYSDALSNRNCAPKARITG